MRKIGIVHADKGKIQQQAAGGKNVSGRDDGVPCPTPWEE
jgi:hypothetical protein